MFTEKIGNGDFSFAVFKRFGLRQISHAGIPDSLQRVEVTDRGGHREGYEVFADNGVEVSSSDGEKESIGIECEKEERRTGENTVENTSGPKS